MGRGGEEGRLRGDFAALKDQGLFEQVMCGRGFMKWPGETTAPDAMYEEIKADGRRVLDYKSRVRHHFSDSLIIPPCPEQSRRALEPGCTRLLSEDRQAGKNIDGLRIEDPFRP